MHTFTKKLILKSFKATRIIPLNPNYILNKFTKTPTNSNSSLLYILTISSNN